MEIFAKVCYNIWKTIIGELYPLENSLFPCFWRARQHRYI